MLFFRARVVLEASEHRNSPVIFSTKQDNCVLRPARSVRLRFVALLAILCAAVSFTSSATRKDSDATLTFVARPPQVLKSGHDTSLFGHAFLIIGLKTSGGVKEEIFGFYCKNRSTPAPDFGRKRQVISAESVT